MIDNPFASKRWYVGQGEVWNGPYSDEEVLRRVQDGNLSWVDYIWTPTHGLRWQRICLMDAFQSYLPKPPSVSSLHDILETIEGGLIPKEDRVAVGKKGRGAPKFQPKFQKEKTLELEAIELAVVKASPRRSIWQLQFEGSEFGPLSQVEVEVILKSGKLKGKLFARREGALEWKEIREFEEFKSMGGKSAAVKTDENFDERRVSRRVPLVATVRFNIPGDTSAGSNRYMGVCRDISSQGMLIMSNRVPADTVESIKLEVSPLGSTGVEPFQTEVEIVRVLADKKGFSVRFKSLGTMAKKTIESYLSRHS